MKTKSRFKTMGNVVARNVGALLLAATFLAAHSATVATAQDSNDPLPDRRVYVPLDQLDVLAGQDRRGVMLARDDFNILLQKAQANVQQNAATPNGLIVTSTDYAAKIDGDHLVIDAVIKFTQFEDGWQSLPLPFANLSVEKATVNNQVASLGRQQFPAQQRKGKGSPAFRTLLVLFNDNAGDSTLRLKLSTLLEAVGNNRAARMSLIPSPSGSIQVEVPAGRQLQLGSKELERPAALDQIATYTVPIGGQQNLLLLFKAHQGEQATDVLTFASTGYGLNVAPGEVTWRAATSLQVHGTTLTQLVCEVPNNLEITNVESTGLEGWELADNPDDAQSTLITLNYRQAFSGTRQVLFEGVLSGVQQSWSVPNLKIRNVTSHTGRVVVKHPAAVRIQRTSAEGVRIRPSEAGTQTFDLWREDFNLAFETRTKNRDIHATISTIADLNGTSINFVGDIDIQTLFAPLFELSFRLPADWTLDSVLLAGKPHRWQTSSREAGWNDYRLVLSSPLKAGKEAKITFTSHLEIDQWPLEDDPFSLSIPKVKVPSASVIVGNFAIKADPDLALTTEDIEGFDPALSNIPGERLGFSFEDAEHSGTLVVSRKPSQMVVSTLTVARLDRETFNSHLEAILNIEGGGFRTLQIQVSESAGDDLRFRLEGTQARIVEQQAADAADGFRVWTLQLDQRVRGEMRLAVDVVANRDGDDEFDVHRIAVVGAERTDGFVAIEGSADQQIEIDAKDAEGLKLDPVDPIDLPATNYLPQQRIVGAYRYTSGGYAVALKEKRFERVAVPTAVCRSAFFRTVVDAAGELQHRATYQLVAVGAQSLRIRMPVAIGDGDTAGELWSATIDGTPVEVRATGNSYLIPLPRVDRPDAERQLVLLYRNHAPSLSASDRLKQSPPLVSVIHSEGEEQPIIMLSQRWEVSYPHSAVIKSSNGDFILDDNLHSDSILGSLQDRFSHLDRDSFTRNLTFAIVFLVVLGGVALALKQVGKNFRGVAAAAVTASVLVILYNVLFPGMSSPRNSSLYIADSTSSTIPHAMSESPNAEFGAAEDAPMEFFDEEMDGDGPMVDLASPAKTSEPTSTQSEKAEAKPGLMHPEGAAQKRDEEMRRPAGAERSVAALPADEPMPDPGADPFDDDQLIRNRPLAQAGNDGQADADGDKAIDGRSVSRSGGVAGKRMSGLLSLSLDLQVPDENIFAAFSYSGTAPADQLALDIGWEDRKTGDSKRIMILLAVAAILWWLIRRKGKARVFVSVGAVIIPLALISIAPISWHVVLDGIFLGGVFALVLWFGRAAYGWICGSCCGQWVCQVLSRKDAARVASKNTAKTTASILLAASIGLNSMDATAADKPNANSSQPKVVIPYSPGQDPLLSNRVLLTRAQFLKLWNLANPNERIKQTAPVKGLVADALFAAKLAEPGNADTKARSVDVKATIIVQSFVDEQITIPIPVGQVAITDARMDGDAAALTTTKTKGGIQSAIVIETKGTHVLDLSFSVPAQVVGPVGQFTLPIGALPAGRATFELPAAGLSVRVNGATNAYRRVKADAAESIDIPVGNGQTLTIAWRPPAEKGAVDSIINIDNNIGVMVSDEGVSQQAQVSIRVPQGAISDLAFAVPDTLRIRGIAGPHLAGWQTDTVNNQRRLRVFFNPPITDATTLSIGLFTEQVLAEGDTTVGIPTISPLEVTREVGVVAVYSSDDFGVRNGDAENVTRLDVNSSAVKAVPKLKSSRPIFARLGWRFVSRPFSLECIATRKAPASKAQVSHAAEVARRRIHMGTRLSATFDGAPRAAVNFKLPDGYLVVNVDATDISDWYITPEDDANPRTLTIEFQRPLIGRVEAVLQGYVVKTPEDFLVDLYLPEPLEITSLESAVNVAFDASYKPQLTGSEGWKEIDADELPADLRQRNSGLQRMAYKSDSLDEKSLEFEIAFKAPEISTNSIVITSVGDAFVEHALYLDWQIEEGAVDTFYFDAPKSLDGQLRVVVPDPNRPDKYIDAPNVRQIEIEEADANHLSRWKVTLKQPVRDRYLALAVVNEAINQKEIQAPAVQFVQPIFDEDGDTGELGPVPGQKAYAILVNPSIYQLRRVPGAGVESVSVDSLPIKLPKSFVDQAAMILRIPNMASAPKWQVRKLEQQAGAPASVNVADLKMVLSKDGTWRTQAIYTIRNRRRQFLALKLPSKSQLLSVFVAGAPTRPVLAAVNEQPVQLIALPKSSDSDTSFAVRVVLSGKIGAKLPDGFTFDSKDVDLPIPHVVGQTESDTYGIPVARTLLSVYVPKDVDASVVDESGLSNLKQSDRSNNEAENAYAKAFLFDLSNANSVMESELVSERQKQLAAQNFDAVNDQLSALAESTNDVKTKQSIIQEQEKFIRNQKRVAAAAQENAEQQVDDSKAGRQRQQALFNNRQILDGNSFASEALKVNPEENNKSGANVKFKLERKGGESAYEKDMKKPATGKSGGTPGERGQGRARGELKQRSLDNISRLNSLFDQQEGMFGNSQRDSDEAPNQPQNRNTRVGRPVQLNQPGGGGFGGGGFGGGGLGAGGFGSGGRGNGMGNDLGGQQMPGNGQQGQGLLNPSENQQPGRADNNAFAQTGSGPAGPAFNGEADGRVRQWSQVGGLSLAIDIPTAGNEMFFSKVAGQPKLTLRLRSKQLVDGGLGFVWTAVWLAIGIIVLTGIGRTSGNGAAGRAIALTLFAAGLACYLVMPSPLREIGLVSFVIGSLGLALRFVRTTKVSST